MQHQKILILDFGSQVTQLIARRVREAHVYCEVHPCDVSSEWVREFAADGQVTRNQLSSLELPLYLSPARLGALMVKPEQMSARELFLYVDYLQAGKQASGRYEIAFWKKMIYPVAVWVMLVLALPAAYIQARGGALGLKVFLAIVAGIGFHLANSLFSHLGLLNDWPAPVVAAIPSLLALAAGLLMLWQLQRRAF